MKSCVNLPSARKIWVQCRVRKKLPGREFLARPFPGAGSCVGLDRLPSQIPPVLQRQTAVWTTLSRPPDLIPSEGHPVLYSQGGDADRKQKRKEGDKENQHKKG